MGNVKEFLQNNKKILLASVVISVVVSGLVGLALGVYVAVNRAEIFDSFASRYLLETQNGAVSGRDGAGEEMEPRTNILREESLIVSAVERANPAVVSIVVTKDVPIIEQYYEEFNDPFFGPFSVPRYRQKGTEEQEVGGGSGFFVSSGGLVVTNRHVVDDPEASYTVFTNSGEQYGAQVLAKDSFFDIAVLRVSGADFSSLSFADSDDLKLGQTAIAIGNALGEFRNSVSVGVVSGLSRSVVAGDASGNSELLEGVIQTDAAINPGNSGGPLLDLNGSVIGVNVAMARGSENIGFALPANLVRRIVDSVRRHGEIRRPYLGVRYLHINEAVKEQNDLPYSYGALIVRGETPQELAVMPGSPADKAGIVENDIILAVDGQRLEGERTLASVIRQKDVGDAVRLTVFHRGEVLDLTVTLEQTPEN